MHTRQLDRWRHDHVFLGANHTRNERRTWVVVAITAAMMLGEIVAGIAYGSMALLADGVHMATHAGALSIAALAYLYARRHVGNARFSFGTGKLGELAGFASAVVLGVVALLIGAESFLRIAEPVPIRFNEAIAVAVLGLLVNLASAWVLHDGGPDDVHEDAQLDKETHEGHRHVGDHLHHHDHNLRSAYLHVLTDALTSVLAIAGLIVGKLYGLVWMDPLMGIVGGVVIARWSWSLLKGAGAVLLDTVPDDGLAEHVRERLEIGGDRITDFHLWRVGPGHVATIVALVSDRPRAPDDYKERLADLPQLAHITVEVHHCEHRIEAA